MAALMTEAAVGKPHDLANLLESGTFDYDLTDFIVDTQGAGDPERDARKTDRALFYHSRDIVGSVSAGREHVGVNNDLVCTVANAGFKAFYQCRMGEFHMGDMYDQPGTLPPHDIRHVFEHTIGFVPGGAVIDNKKSFGHNELKIRSLRSTTVPAAASDVNLTIRGDSVNKTYGTTFRRDQNENSV